ncbi:MAG: endonuclease domain-containing protein, partial [Solirubrobacterales bacterium]
MKGSAVQISSPALAARAVPWTRISASPFAHGLKPYRSDFVWERARLIVETDGGRFHSGPIARSRDVERDRNLRRAGWELVRLTDEHLDDAEAESRRGGAPGLAEWIIRRIGLAGP